MLITFGETKLDILSLAHLALRTQHSASALGTRIHIHIHISQPQRTAKRDVKIRSSTQPQHTQRKRHTLRSAHKTGARYYSSTQYLYCRSVDLLLDCCPFHLAPAAVCIVQCIVLYGLYTYFSYTVLYTCASMYIHTVLYTILLYILYTSLRESLIRYKHKRTRFLIGRRRTHALRSLKNSADFCHCAKIQDSSCWKT